MEGAIFWWLGTKKEKMSAFPMNWVEILFTILLVVGFVFSLATPSAFLSYLIVLCMGMMCGRFLYMRKKNTNVPVVFIGVGFLIGYVLGTRYGNWVVLIALFFLGDYLSYWLHDKGYLKPPY